jgi:hypothetical protein
VFATALGYLRNHWKALVVYTTNGLIPIDNNDVEQLMKRVATGRNYAEFKIMRCFKSVLEVLPGIAVIPNIPGRVNSA